MTGLLCGAARVLYLTACYGLTAFAAAWVIGLVAAIIIESLEGERGYP